MSVFRSGDFLASHLRWKRNPERTQAVVVEVVTLGYQKPLIMNLATHLALRRPDLRVAAFGSDLSYPTHPLLPFHQDVQPCVDENSFKLIDMVAIPSPTPLSVAASRFDVLFCSQAGARRADCTLTFKPNSLGYLDVAPSGRYAAALDAHPSALRSRTLEEILKPLILPPPRFTRPVLALKRDPLLKEERRFLEILRSNPGSLPAHKFDLHDEVASLRAFFISELPRPEHLDTLGVLVEDASSWFDLFGQLEITKALEA